jgi:hypothetical protein
MKLKKEVRDQKFKSLQDFLIKEESIKEDYLSNNKEYLPKSNNVISKIIGAHPQTIKRWLALIDEGKTLYDSPEQAYRPRIDKKKVLDDDGTWEFIRITVPLSVQNDYCLLDSDIKVCLWKKINNAILSGKINISEPPLKEAEGAISIKISKEVKLKWLELNTFSNDSISNDSKKTGSKGASLCRSVIIPFLDAVL